MVTSSEVDDSVVRSFMNFMSWELRPYRRDEDIKPPFPAPPAVLAYMAGLTSYCPPRGTW